MGNYITLLPNTYRQGYLPKSFNDMDEEEVLEYFNKHFIIKLDDELTEFSLPPNWTIQASFTISYGIVYHILNLRKRIILTVPKIQKTNMNTYLIQTKYHDSSFLIYTVKNHGKFWNYRYHHVQLPEDMKFVKNGSQYSLYKGETLITQYESPYFDFKN
jgi:hypothetical protein